MKKFFIISLITIAALGCAKKRTCTETTTDTNGAVSTNVENFDKLTSKQKKDIENFGTYTEDDGTKHVTECK